MNIKEYINRNLPNINFNILPQIFEAEDVELTEEIVEYLKTTPWNTNWNVFESLGEGGGNKSIIMDATVNFFSAGGIGLYTVDYSLENHDITVDYITVVYDGINIRLPRDSTTSVPAFGEVDENHSAIFTNYPIYVNFTGGIDSYNLQITNTDPGDHSIKIIIDQPGLPSVVVS